MIGFTGTRKGMTDAQKSAVKYHLLYTSKTRVAHGDCVGADEEFHHIARELDKEIYVYPPDNPKNRAFCKGADKVMAPVHYHLRNTHIRRGSDYLLATPGTEFEIQRSGTWSMIRQMVKEGKRVLIIYPSGKIEER